MRSCKWKKSTNPFKVANSSKKSSYLWKVRTTHTYDEPVTDEPKKLRFLTIAQAADELNVNQNQIRALLRTGELRGIQLGGRGYLGR